MRGNQNSTPWTAQMDARLVKLRAEGASSRAIAGLLSEEFPVTLSKNSILGRVHRLQAKGTKISPRQRAAALPKPKITADPDGLPLLGQCSWPLWPDDARPGDARLFCLAPTDPVLSPSWCPKHRAIGLSDSRVHPGSAAPYDRAKGG